MLEKLDTDGDGTITLQEVLYSTCHTCTITPSDTSSVHGTLFVWMHGLVVYVRVATNSSRPPPRRTLPCWPPLTNCWVSTPWLATWAMVP